MAEEERDEEQDDSRTIRLSAGLRVDAKERFALVLLSEEAVSVTLERYDVMPCPQGIDQLVSRATWLVIWRDEGEKIFKVHGMDGPSQELQVLATTRQMETAQMAIEVALFVWPGWGINFKSQYQPRWVIPLKTTILEA